MGDLGTADDFACGFRGDERYRSCERCYYADACSKSYLECREHIAEQDTRRFIRKVEPLRLPIVCFCCTFMFILYVSTAALHQFDVLRSAVMLVVMMACMLVVAWALMKDPYETRKEKERDDRAKRQG